MCSGGPMAQRGYGDSGVCARGSGGNLLAHRGATSRKDALRTGQTGVLGVKPAALRPESEPVVFRPQSRLFLSRALEVRSKQRCGFLHDRGALLRRHMLIVTRGSQVFYQAGRVLPNQGG